MGNTKGFTLWLTGLSGAGKTTLALRMVSELKQRGLDVELLDGDEVRTNLSKGLGFSKEDRDTNIRRIGYVCRLLSRNGVVAISAAISPYRSLRDEVRDDLEKDGAVFVEVFVKCPIAVLAERDVKGLYKKALAGEIKGFTGISDPYEEPLAPAVIVETDHETVEASVGIIMRELDERHLLPEPSMASSPLARSSLARRTKVADRSQRTKVLGRRKRLTILKKLFLRKQGSKR